uniref:Tankyrase-1 n=2 Tax=Culex pipiens TaxID=7175 RepID=A0A8D8C8B3_CULPI
MVSNFIRPDSVAAVGAVIVLLKQQHGHMSRGRLGCGQSAARYVYLRAPTLHLADGLDNLEVTKYLLKHGADLNAQDTGGLIPLPMRPRCIAQLSSLLRGLSRTRKVKQTWVAGHAVTCWRQRALRRRNLSRLFEASGSSSAAPCLQMTKSSSDDVMLVCCSSLLGEWRVNDFKHNILKEIATLRDYYQFRFAIFQHNVKLFALLDV